MKKFYALDGSDKIPFADEKALNDYVSSHPSSTPLVTHEWESTEIRASMGDSWNPITLETEAPYPLEAAIRIRWRRILYGAKIWHGSDYYFKNIRVQRQGDKCTITMQMWNIARCMIDFGPQENWPDDQLMTRVVTFDGVEDGDLPSDDFLLDIPQKPIRFIPPDADEQKLPLDDVNMAVGNWLYTENTPDEAKEIVFDGEPYYDGTWKQDLHDSKHRYTLIIEPNGDVLKE